MGGGRSQAPSLARPLQVAGHSRPVLMQLAMPMVTGDMERVERLLRSKVQTDDQRVCEVVSHLVDAGGKRVRPLLALCAAYSVQEGGADRPVDDRAVTAAVSIELMHLGSLHHDDVIDEADTRRGVPSVNVRWQNTTAVLSGDILLAASSTLGASLGPEEAIIVAGALSTMCTGQMRESYTLFDAERAERDYLACIEGKTAALMEAACRLGALEGGAPPAAQDALGVFGREVGIAFQIIDDVRDIQDDGTNPGSDLAEGVYTLPVIYARERAPEITSLLAARDEDPGALDQARRVILASGAMGDAVHAAGGHLDRGRAALVGADGLDPGVRAQLLDLAERVVSLGGADRTDPAAALAPTTAVP